MRIETNADIISFMNRVAENVRTKDFEGDTRITNKNKNIVLKKMQAHDSEIGSIYFKSELVTENPYYKNISLKNITNEKFQYVNKTIDKNIATNISWIRSDKNRELADYIVLAASEEDINMPVLTQGGITWMSPTLAETNTINPCVEKAHGDVLTFGLGLGYFPYMCSLKDSVDSITVVEYDEEVISMFKQNILPQFKYGDKIKIIHGDMFDYLYEDFLDKYEYIFVDIWKDNEHGLSILEKVFEKINYKGNIDYWIEDSCYMPLRMLVFLYFRALFTGRVTHLICDFKGDDNVNLKKINKYFKAIDISISDPENLKDYMYDVHVMRDILSTKLRY